MLTPLMINPVAQCSAVFFSFTILRLHSETLALTSSKQLFLASLSEAAAGS